MATNIDKSQLHAVIDELPPHALNSFYEMILMFINDYKDSHLTQEEYAAHMQALKEDEWYD